MEMAATGQPPHHETRLPCYDSTAPAGGATLTVTAIVTRVSRARSLPRLTTGGARRDSSPETSADASMKGEQTNDRPGIALAKRARARTGLPRVRSAHFPRPLSAVPIAKCRCSAACGCAREGPLWLALFGPVGISNRAEPLAPGSFARSMRRQGCLGRCRFSAPSAPQRHGRLPLAVLAQG
jgi:hypothetical protein